MAKSDNLIKLERMVDDLKDKYEFQKKCLLHWVKQCEAIEAEFHTLETKINDNVDSYELNLNRDEEDSDLVKEYEGLRKKMIELENRSNIEEKELAKVSAEIEVWTKALKEMGITNEN